MVKVGITGLGFMGMIHYLAYQQLEGVKVTAMCESIPERLAGDWTSIKGNFGPQGTMMDLSGIATYADMDDMFADPNVDMVDICLPPHAHADTVVKALKAGKHVLSEKPIALSLADADRMVAASKETGKFFMVAHVIPFYAAYSYIYEAKMSGRYGKLLGGHFDRVISDPVWIKDFYNMETCGGPMLDLHIHDAHYIRLLFGMPKTVQSVGRMRDGVPEYFNTQFLYDNPEWVVSATSGVIFQQGRPFTQGFEVHFEKATILCETFNQVPLTILTEDGRVEKADLPARDDIQTFACEMKEATDAVRKGEVSPILSGQLARDALALGLKEIESIRTRKPVDL